ncbi:MAG: gamma-glutamylcyclotransferase family protein [Nitrosomonadaceae bacterium]
MNVFFYGLFMDEDLLAKKGISPSKAEVGFVDGFALRIGERATLIRSADTRSYGVMMNISSDQANELYAESSVADYVPESVTVELLNGSKVEASCYNLPVDKVTGTNKVYAQALLEVANRLGLPERYLVEIRQAGV